MLIETIEHKLRQRFATGRVEVEVQRVKGGTLAQQQTQLNITIVADCFAGQRLLQRHREVYQSILEEIGQGSYLILLQTYTPNEWDYLKNNDLRVTSSYARAV